MNTSGTNNENASQARMREPSDCPARVKRGQVEASTQRRVERYRKLMVGGWRWMLKRLRTRARMASLLTSWSPV